MDRATDILDIISTRKAAGEPFALATVVRTVAATAAKAGAKAVILPDGTISEGWIGGGCARAAVLKAAQDALADGTLAARLGAAARRARRAGRRRAGEEQERRALRQEHVPEPGHDGHLRRAGAAAAAGRSSAARARSPSRSPISPGAPALPSRSARRRPSRPPSRDADRRIEGYALPVDEAGARYVVVSTQGRGDEAALLAALAVDADYVAFVGSRKKAEALKATLVEARRSGRASGQAQGARRPRSRRDHAGRDRDLDPGRDRRRAAAQAFAWRT